MASKILNKLLPFFLSPTLPALPTASPAIFNTSAWPPSSIITRDICIIGGGSTGTYSAIRLSDSNNTVVVIEADPRLGGHTNTYTDPATNETVDYGVVSFHNTTIVKDYFARFDIPLATASFALPGQVNEYVDFRTGQTVPGNVPANYSAALAAYGAQLAKYPYLETGFDLPYPVPADLLLPFGDFVTKYNLQAAVGFLFQFAQGLGNLLEQPTLYVFKNFGQGILQGLRTGFLTPARHDNGELYARALATLGANNVLLQSRVIATDRSGAGAGAGVVKVVVQTPQGPKLVLANKLLLTIPPKPDNLAGFDLSANESALFAQFANSAYYTALIRDPAIPPAPPRPLRPQPDPRPGPLRRQSRRRVRDGRRRCQIPHRRERGAAQRQGCEHDGARVRGVREPCSVRTDGVEGGDREWVL